MKWTLFKRAKAEDADDDQVRIDYRLTFGSDHGRRVLADLVEQCHLFHPSYIPEDVGGTQYREGERNVMLYILSRLQLPQKEIIEEVIDNG